jgi:hypothetical protein
MDDVQVVGEGIERSIAELVEAADAAEQPAAERAPA